MSAREELAQSIAANLDRMFGKREFGPATQDAPESPASVRADTRSNPGAIGAQGGVGLKGKCKLCAQPVTLKRSGLWVHDGMGFGIHLAVMSSMDSGGGA